MAVWGHKAPYWIFVEFGTAAGGSEGTAFPQFAGEQPIFRTKQWADSGGIQKIINDFIQTLEAELTKEVNVWFVEDRVPDDSAEEIKERIETIAWSRWFRRGGKDVSLGYWKEGGGFTGASREAVIGTHTTG